MYYKEKRTIATLISGILLLTVYCILAVQWAGAEGADTDLELWALRMLIFIAIGIAATIIILIVFHIINAVINEVKQLEQDAIDIEDEMDKLISLKSMKNGYIVVGFGFVFSLISLVMKLPSAVMLNIVFLSFNAGGLVEGFSQLYFYRRGVKNG